MSRDRGAGPDDPTMDRDRTQPDEAPSGRRGERDPWPAGPPWRGGRRGWGRRRPPWWPEEEPWPPLDQRHWWRGFGCLFFLVMLVVIVGLVSLVAGAVGGLVSGGGPIGDVLRIVGVVVVLAGLAGLLVAGSTIRGSAAILDDLGAAASRVEDGDYTARVRIRRRGPRPLRNLVRAFNTMVGRLEIDERRRRSLLADVSHELRTPLAVVQGQVEAILDGVHPADAAHLAAILDETAVLTRLVDDLRTLALSEGGTLALHREPTDLAILATDVATAMGPVAGDAGLALNVDAAEELPLVDADPVRVREILTNLVANAIRHTPAGGQIAVRVRPSTGAGPGEPAEVELAVADTGSGIDAELLPHVFERFVRGAGSAGSGLGLAIARGLAEAHGGSIAADSQAGLGTTITVRLPVRA